MEAPFGLEEVIFQSASVAKAPFVEVDLRSKPWKDITREEAVATTKTYIEARSTSITSKFVWLGEVIPRHAPVLMKRWEKHGKQKGRREKILSEAWGGDMRTTTLSTSKSSFKDNVDLSIRRDVWLCPYINKEALSAGNTLLQMLSARAKHDPVDFIATDLAAMDLVNSNIADCLPDLIKDHVLCIRGTSSTDGMVKLLPSKSNPGGSEGVAGLGLAEGLLALEASDRVLTFATDVIKGILHDIAVSKLLDYPVSDVDLSPPEDSSNVKSLAQATAELPYGKPAVADLEHLVSILAAVRDAAADHIHAFREDPQYYEYCVQERLSYRAELVPDVLGRTNAQWKGEDSVLMKAVEEELVESYVDLERWSVLYDQAVEIHSLRQTATATSAERLSMAMLRFRDFVLTLAGDMLAELPILAFKSPILKDHARINVERTHITWRQGHKASKAIQMLVTMCGSLSERAPGYLAQGKAYPMHEFQRLVDFDEDIAAIIPERVERQISDIGLMTECVRQIQLLQPLSRSLADEAAACQGALDADYAVFQTKRESIETCLKAGARQSAELGVPKGRKFEYPVEKRRNQNSVERMRESEQNLDAHWTAVDRIVAGAEKMLSETACWQDFSTPRSLVRTPEWESPTTTTSAKLEPFVPPPDANVWDSQLANTFQHRPKPVATKIKEKTRGTAQPQDVPIVDAPAEIAPEATVFDVDQRALDVFQTLFYTPDLPGRPGEVAWSELLYAMTFIGFHAEQLYGSAWHFSSPTMGRGFHFHQPHPSPKIAYRKVRRYGRTLQRALGWDARTFRLET